MATETEQRVMAEVNVREREPGEWFVEIRITNFDRVTLRRDAVGPFGTRVECEAAVADYRAMVVQSGGEVLPPKAQMN